jgi:glutathione S-transferase
MPSSQITLHLDPATVNSRKVLASLDLLAVPYTLKKVDYFGGAHKTREYLAINPCGTVPCAIIDDSLVLTESNAIIAYAGELASNPPQNGEGKGNEAAFPKDPKKRADVLRWLFWETSVWFPSCYVYLIEAIVKPCGGKAPDLAVLKKEEPRWRELASVLEHKLLSGGGGRKWLCGGEEPTVADVAVASSMVLWKRARFPIEGFPALRKWMVRVEGLGCWIRTQGDVERRFPDGGEEGKVFACEGEC